MKPTCLFSFTMLVYFFQVYSDIDKEVQERAKDAVTSNGTFEEEYHNGKR